MKKCKSGFTLSELLVVVGILVVLLAAAVPGIVAINRNLNQKQLDGYAREIFIEAQNQLLAHNIVGTVDKIDAAATGSNIDDYYWLVGNDAVKLLLEGDAIDIIDDYHQCILKYNPVTSTVLEVYYASKNMDVLAVKSGTYAGDSAAAERSKEHIGYFYGSDADSGRIERMPTPQIELLNGEELIAKVTVPAYAPASGSFNGVMQKVSVTVQELDSAGEPIADRSFVLIEAAGLSTSLGYSEDAVLDSVENDSFKNISGGKITPGADILVTASIAYESGGDSDTVYLSSEDSAKVNSLFASVENGTAKIACGRHLQNLSTGFSGVSGITAAVQTEQISWNDSHPGATFIPISNSALKSYDGNNNEIVHLSVSVAMGELDNAGLFASLEGAALKNIRLCDIYVFSPSVATGKSSGTMAGQLNSCSVSNCRVYNSTGVYSNSEYVGGLIGRASDCTVTGCFANVFSVKSGYRQTVGGLLGRADNVTITNSYSNIGVMGYAEPYYLWADGSGLVSESTDGGGNGTVGGLVGYGVGSSASHCYVCGYVPVAGSANAYFGNGSVGSTAADCYSLLSYNEEGVASFTSPTDNNCWADGTENRKKAYDVDASGLRSWADARTLWVYGRESYATNTNGVALDAPYPYPMIEGVAHYGDWPAPYGT